MTAQELAVAVSRLLKSGTRRREQFRSPMFVDVLLLLALSLLSVSLVAIVQLGVPPWEDAAMVMRYADHLAAGHGLVWNIGEAPVDGATDFLFTVVVAGLRMVGIEIELATRAVIVFGWVSTTLLIYVSARRVLGTSPAIAFVATIPIALGPGILYARAGFGAPFFGLWVATSSILMLRLINEPTAKRTISVLLGLSVLLLGLTRPEGVVLGIFLVLAVAVKLGFRAAIDRLSWGLSLFIVLGGAYFLWRWSYFGYPLPNPYYKKGGGTLHLDGLAQSLKGSLWFAFPFAALWLLALADSKTRRTAAALAVPIVGFMMIWSMLSPEMNFAYRFQYPILVLVAVFWPMLFVQIRESPGEVVPNLQSHLRMQLWRHRFLTIAIVASSLLVFPIGAIYLNLRASNGAEATDQRAVIGELLAPYAARGYTIATTEAGLIPLKSHWRALDTWGLNDQAIAHRGYITASDLDQRRPLVAFIHMTYVPGHSPLPSPLLGQAWTNMTLTLNAWLNDHEYRLVRSVSDGGQGTWNVWVLPGSADSQAIAELLACRTYGGEPNIVPVSLVSKCQGS